MPHRRNVERCPGDDSSRLLLLNPAVKDPGTLEGMKKGRRCLHLAASKWCSSLCRPLSPALPLSRPPLSNNEHQPPSTTECRHGSRFISNEMERTFSDRSFQSALSRGPRCWAGFGLAVLDTKKPKIVNGWNA